ncbi:GNAT family N-acetyltransferase [Nisaea acidiphila]|uniref:GNAT family N-acetyltransferase n=1 Tax=Nisaea acidiphila TaxID=1862145 RepID=A0A9J7AYT8_9PROT|nr:GNAT family N-acetyltransferase [Nisaea acidiphila]UUX51954.1 GNAT family N-acetyltransferase [Nisaea acidiphila]
MTETSETAAPVTPALETERLLLRPLELADADVLQKLFPQWEIVRYLGSHVPWPYPHDGALFYVRDIALPAMRAGTEWNWTLRPKSEPGTLIGVIGLMSQPDNNRGFWLLPEWRGRGMMSEAVEAVTEFWFETLKQPVLRVPKAIANKGSRRISERTGMRVIATGEKDYVSGRLPMELWEITREEWQARRGTANPPAP